MEKESEAEKNKDSKGEKKEIPLFEETKN